MKKVVLIIDKDPYKVFNTAAFKDEDTVFTSIFKRIEESLCKMINIEPKRLSAVLVDLCRFVKLEDDSKYKIAKDDDDKNINPAELPELLSPYALNFVKQGIIKMAQLAGAKSCVFFTYRIDEDVTEVEQLETVWLGMTIREYKVPKPIYENLIRCEYCDYPGDCYLCSGSGEQKDYGFCPRCQSSGKCFACKGTGKQKIMLPGWHKDWYKIYCSLPK